MLKDSQTHRPSKCSAFNGAQHIFSPAKLFQNMISKNVHHFGRTAGVIRVKKVPKSSKYSLQSHMFFYSFVVNLLNPKKMVIVSEFSKLLANGMGLQG